MFITRQGAANKTTHSAEQAYAKRARKELSRMAPERVVEPELLSEPVRCAAEDLLCGLRSTTAAVNGSTSVGIEFLF